MLEHQTRMGEVLRESLEAAGWRIVNSTPLPVVCFTRDGLGSGRIAGGSSRAPDRVDVGGAARRRSGDPGMHHQLQNHRAGHRVGSG